MKRCTYCGRQNEDSVPTCTSCGTDEFDQDIPALTTPKCDRCGATTELPELFRRESGSVRSPGKIFCPDCWQKRNTSYYSALLIVQLSTGLFGFAFWCLLANKGVGIMFLNIFLLQIAAVLSTLPHELGHAFVGRYLGWFIYRIFVGFGRTLCTATLFGFKTEFRIVPVSGSVLGAPRDISHYRLKLFLFVLAGPLTNCILIALSFSLIRYRHMSFGVISEHLMPVQALFVANLLLLFENLLPRIITTPAGNVRSNGLYLIHALKATPKQAAESHAMGLFWQSFLSIEKNQLGDADALIEEGLKCYPEDFWLLTAKGTNCIFLGKFGEAREVFLRALGHAGDERINRLFMLDNIAFADALLGGSDLLMEADRYSAEALSNISWLPGVKGTRGTVLMELGKIDEALPLLGEALTAADSPLNKAQSACLLAIGQAKRGNADAARKYLEQARKFNPTCYLLPRAENALNQNNRLQMKPAG